MKAIPVDIDDERYLKIRRRWEQLSNEQLWRVLNASAMCTDSYNFDESTGLF